jgi:hypothetical protein
MMDLMSSDPQPARPGPASPETVVEFGTDPDEPRPRRRRWSVTEVATGLAADRRAVPLAAALGAVALFASLMSEWQVTVLVTAPFGEARSGNRPLPSGIGDLGALGSGFLVGLFVLAGAMALVLFGPTAGRRHARLLGLTSGSVLAAVLIALAADLGDTSRAVDMIFLLDLDENQVRLSYGRGLWCAFFGVAAVLLALYLAGRHTSGPDEIGAAEAGTADGDRPAPAAEAPVVWSWRRPRAEPDDEQPPDAPFDLTVSSTKPFTSLSGDREEPPGDDRRT